MGIFLTMQITDQIPEPLTLADQLRNLSPGKSGFIPVSEHRREVVRTILSRIVKSDPTRRYKSKKEDDGIRVWRIA